MLARLLEGITQVALMISSSTISTALMVKHLSCFTFVWWEKMERERWYVLVVDGQIWRSISKCM